MKQAYPILAGIFFNGSVAVQLVVVVIGFFGMRVSYEYAIENVTSVYFGSDSLTMTSFGAVR